MSGKMHNKYIATHNHIGTKVNTQNKAKYQ